MTAYKEHLSYAKKPIEELKDLADRQGNSSAQYFYGIKLIYEQTEGTADTTDLGVEYITRSAQNGCADAEYWMAGDALNPKIFTQTPEQQDKGFSFLKSAALKNHFNAAITLGYVHFNAGKMHNLAEAARVWTEACNNHETADNGASPNSTPFIFCSKLSDLFSDASYGGTPRSDLAASLHILSTNKFVTSQKQRDVLLTLSDIEANKPQLFNRLKNEGLEWPSADRLAVLGGDEKIHVSDRREQLSIIRERISICNSLGWTIMMQDDIRTEITDYLKGKLPPEITNIPQMKLVFES